MKKETLGLIASVLLLIISLFAFRGTIFDIFKDDITAHMFLNADNDAFDPGLPIGADFPPIQARYQGGTVTDVGQFMGERGMIFVANRSVDWCPFCMQQLVQLQEHVSNFEQAGLPVVAMTYDAPDLQQPFLTKNKITYPLLSDIEGASANALGILNAQYQPGDEHYGIPYPGIYVLSTDGKIIGKMFIESYRNRVNAAAVLSYAELVLRKR